MLLLQNEQRILHDVSIQMMVYLAMTFQVPAESVKVTWMQDGKKWLPEIGLAQPPEGKTPEEIREAIVGMYRQARLELAQKFAENRVTRFHGGVVKL